MRHKDAKLLNGLALAYMGDAAFEIEIREHLLSEGQTKPNQLHHRATQYVSAKAQAFLIQEMFEADVLTEDEQTYYKRGRNSKSHSKAKNADSQTYTKSTGFEALIGYLYLTEQEERFNEIIAWCIAAIEEKRSKNK